MSRRVTKARSFGFRTSEHTGVEFQQGWAAGAYVVWVKGQSIAHCTDKWMAEMILAEVVGDGE